MNKKLFVCNLDYQVTEAELKELFSNVGTVEKATIIQDKEAKQSKGYGFVEMSTPEEAESAIQHYHGHALLGRNIIVDHSKARTPKD